MKITEMSSYILALFKQYTKEIMLKIHLQYKYVVIELFRPFVLVHLYDLTCKLNLLQVQYVFICLWCVLEFMLSRSHIKIKLHSRANLTDPEMRDKLLDEVGETSSCFFSHNKFLNCIKCCNIEETLTVTEKKIVTYNHLKPTLLSLNTCGING